MEPDLRTPPRRWPRELLVVLAFAPPVLGLVFEPDGMRHELTHQARSLLAIWIYSICLGLGLQVVTDLVTARWPSLLDGAVGALRHVALTLVTVAVLTGILARPLVWTCPGIDGRVDTLLLRGLLLSVVYLLAGRLYQSVLRAREDAITSRSRAEQQLAEARYAALMSRTQPHFLHNALTAAAGLVPHDPDAAERVLRDLGSLFREIVQGSDKRTIRAADELQTVERYLRIQQIRFAPRLEVEIVDETLAADELVPPLVLLPFVENAVLHGLSDGKPTCVRVALDLEPDHVLFTVTDDGPGIGGSRHEDGAHIGTADVRARLSTLYGDASSVVTRPASPSAERPGFVVEVRIPREEA
jgi:signal transduction histidine kinase